MTLLQDSDGEKRIAQGVSEARATSNEFEGSRLLSKNSARDVYQGTATAGSCNALVVAPGPAVIISTVELLRRAEQQSHPGSRLAKIPGTSPSLASDRQNKRDSPAGSSETGTEELVQERSTSDSDKRQLPTEDQGYIQPAKKRRKTEKKAEATQRPLRRSTRARKPTRKEG